MSGPDLLQVNRVRGERSSDNDCRAPARRCDDESTDAVLTGPTRPPGGRSVRRSALCLILLLVGAGCSGLPGTDGLRQLTGLQAPEQWEPDMDAAATNDYDSEF